MTQQRESYTMTYHVTNNDLLAAGIFGGILLNNAANNRAKLLAETLSADISTQTYEITKRLDAMHQFELLTDREKHLVRMKVRRIQRQKLVADGRAQQRWVKTLEIEKLQKQINDRKSKQEWRQHEIVLFWICATFPIWGIYALGNPILPLMITFVLSPLLIILGWKIISNKPLDSHAGP
jgi:hypothetical protein